jgi:hypothetical protein
MHHALADLAGLAHAGELGRDFLKKLISLTLVDRPQPSSTERSFHRRSVPAAWAARRWARTDDAMRAATSRAPRNSPAAESVRHAVRRPRAVPHRRLHVATESLARWPEHKSLSRDRSGHFRPPSPLTASPPVDDVRPLGVSAGRSRAWTRTSPSNALAKNRHPNRSRPRSPSVRVEPPAQKRHPRPRRGSGHSMPMIGENDANSRSRVLGDDAPDWPRSPQA